VQRRLFHLRTETQAYIMTDIRPTSQPFPDEKWVMVLAFITDITCLHKLCVKLKGKRILQCSLVYFRVTLCLPKFITTLHNNKYAVHQYTTLDYSKPKQKFRRQGITQKKAYNKCKQLHVSSVQRSHHQDVYFRN
jgi:hypothetical protein